MFLRSLPVVLPVQLLALFLVGGYRGTWRHFGLMDAWVFAKGVAFGTGAALIVILFTSIGFAAIRERHSSSMLHCCCFCSSEPVPRFA